MAKKGLILLVLVILAGLAAYHFLGKKDEAPNDIPEMEELGFTSANDSVTLALNALLTDYYKVKNALVKSSAAAADSAVMAFAQSTATLPFETLNADTALLQLAVSLKSRLKTDIAAMQASQSLEEKRKAFQSISDNVYDLLRSMQYKGSKVYQQFCPMAFGNTGGAWLSNSEEILNPYFGDQMLHCGEVRDSIAF